MQGSLGAAKLNQFAGQISVALDTAASERGELTDYAGQLEKELSIEERGQRKPT